MQSKEKILQAALVLFVKNGFHQTTIASIAKKASLSKGIMYHYFDSKEQLMLALFLRIKTGFYQTALEQIAIDEHFKDSLRGIWFGLLKWITNHSVEFRYLMQCKTSAMYELFIDNQIINDLDQALAEFLKVGMEKKKIKFLPLPFIMDLKIQMLNTCMNYLENYPEEDNETFRQISWLVFWDSVKLESIM